METYKEEPDGGLARAIGVKVCGRPSEGSPGSLFLGKAHCTVTGEGPSRGPGGRWP